MKILTIIGSSKNGNTSEVVKYFEKQLKSKEDITFEYLYLKDNPIDFCVGCHNCIFLGEDKCPQYANIKPIEDKMLESDAVILASPGYMFSVTGIMKNFLDHVAYNCHRPKYFDKKMYLLSAATKWQEDGVFIPMETWAKGAGFTLIGKTYIEMLPFPLNSNELDKIRNKINRAADKFYIGLKDSKIPKKKLGDILIFHSFRTLCKIAPDILKADYKYFNEKNAYDRKTKWYNKNARISNFTHALANFIEKRINNTVRKMLDLEKIKNNKAGYKNKL